MKKISKKIFVAVLTIAFAFAAFAEDGIKFSGFIRAGIEGNLDSQTFNTASFNDGCYYGHATSRLRLNLDIDKGQYGVNLRYQANKFGFNPNGSEVSNAFFSEGNIKYAMGYAKFLDNQLIVGAGKLRDKYTGSDGSDKYNLAEVSGSSSVYGVSLTYTPVENLYLTPQFATLNPDKFAAGDSKVDDGKAAVGQIKFNEKLLAFSAKYTNDLLTVAGGYSLSGQGYGFFKYKGLENLNLEVEAKYLSKELTGVTDSSGNKAFSLKVSELFAFQNDAIEAGVLVYETLCKDQNVYEFYPFASYNITDVVAATLDVGIIYDEESEETTYSVTPAAQFNVGKAELRVFYNYDKDGKSSIGTTTKISF